MNICIYHGVDLDGYCSAAIWKQVHPDGELIGMNYGDDIPWERLGVADVTLVDFCLQPWSEMEILLACARSVTWIDHHKSAIESWKAVGCPFIRGSRDISKAACELTWEFFHDGERTPRGVFLLGDYDCWRHSDSDTMPYQMGMRLMDMDPNGDDGERAMRRWDYVLGDDHSFFHNVVSAGQTVVEYQTQQNAKASKALWFPVVFDDKRWMAVNQGGINSTFWDAIWDEQFDGCLGFVRSKKHWTVSLYARSNDGPDCGDIAKRHGGGGHQGAAGFQCQELPFQW